jgi:hypothetical protein
MDTPSPSVRDLAQRLLAAEAATERSADAPAHAAVRVIVKLGNCLTEFAGADGFAALMRRALTLARVEEPSLRNVKLMADGSLEGFEAIAHDPATGKSDVGVAITAHLLALLVTFIGHPLTLRMVREAWPDAGVDE